MKYVIEAEERELPAFSRQSYGSAADLRRELSERNVIWARRHNFHCELSLGALPAVLYCEDEQGRHGNFHPASYSRIQNNPGWKRRLKKSHTSARKILLSREKRSELDSCNSSDALLMSIFCHPQISKKGGRLHSLLGVDKESTPAFGYKPRIPLKKGRTDTTEIDLRMGNLLVEAKLTETDFQTAPWHLVERYRDLEEVFHVEDLPQSGDSWLSYQLLRGALAAHAGTNTRFCVVCDTRRPDLIEGWYRVVQCVRSPELRCRMGLLTWQEIAAVCGRPLQRWLQEKYGIIPPNFSPTAGTRPVAPN